MISRTCIALAATVAAAQTLPGIDVSHFQGNIDWKSVAASGQKFVMMKATEGTNYVDPSLAANWAGSHAAGLTRGAYHFGHPSVDAVAQANFFVDAVNKVGGYPAGSHTLQFMLDLEDADGLGPAAVWAWVQAFMGQVKARTGRPGIIYTGYYFWQDNVGGPKNNLDAPLWLAAYDANPLIPDAWGSWTFWQYNDNGKIPGIAGNVDVDKFAGSAAVLEKFCF